MCQMTGYFNLAPEAMTQETKNGYGDVNKKY
jgi:hypothetical protein